MLFNSYVFLFAFLPTVVAGFFLLARVGRTPALLWLTAASLLFYAWWDSRFLLLFLPSIVFNYGAGVVLARLPQGGGQARAVLAGAVGLNLIVLFYFKYWMFAVGSFGALTGTAVEVQRIVLPIGISFFTFTQIAFLVDVYSGTAREYRFLHYALFVSYFPHLIAGPIIHHRDIIPQLGREGIYRFNATDALVGVTIFAIGLVKKVGVADRLSPHASALFDAARDGTVLTFGESWTAALLYTFQLYFDFSGYCDMAIGLSLLFGIRLPINFNSPYKAVSIVDFWRRWHITLSRFLRDYLYIPLGGNRHGAGRRYANLMITMILGGLWHGAAWTFIIWGALHGLYLLVNHAWTALRQRLWPGYRSQAVRYAGAVLTFVAVVFAWVFFRAESVAGALSITGAMLDPLGVVQERTFPHGLFPRNYVFGLLLLAGALVWLFPNSQQLLRAWSPALGTDDGVGRRWLEWRPSLAYAIATGAFLAFGILSLSNVSEFIYFNF